MSSSEQYEKVVTDRASVYKLVDNRKWEEYGQSGSILVYFYQVTPGSLYCKWWKNGLNKDWLLVPDKLKPKGDRAWVCRAKVGTDTYTYD